MELKRARPVDRRAVAECRDLLTDFRHPDRLVNNSLVASIFRSAFTSPRRVQLLEILISRSLSRLAPRDRTIVQRCDVDGERFTNVACDLGISERHLYRERRRILNSLAAIIADCTRDTERIQFEWADEFAAQLRSSRILEENGADKAGATVIENLLLETTDPALKCNLFLRLAQLHARSGRFAKAKEFLHEAAGRAQESESIHSSLMAELHATRAYIFEQCGHGEVVVSQEAADAARLLLRDGSFRYDEKSACSLIRALLLCGLSYTSTGQARELERVTQQARNVFDLLRRPDEEAQMAVMLLASLRSLFCVGDLSAAIASLSQAVAVARSAGFTLSSMVHLANLASVYSLQKQPEIAAKHLQGVLPVVRELGNSQVLLTVLLELSNTYVDLQKYEEAQDLLLECAKLSTENETLRTAMICTSAEVSVAIQQFPQGLEAARMAEALFGALGKTRLVGTPLRLQAQAFLGLGERRAAYRAISEAIDALSTKNSDAMLDRANEVLEQIKGTRPSLPGRNRAV